MVKVNYWKEQEKFAKHILKYVLNILVSENFIFSTTIWKYQLTYIDEKWTTDWWSQLTDKILKLHLKNLNTQEILTTYLYIESKAYFSENSESITSIQKSFREFYTKLWDDFWYASMYCIVKWWETYWTYPFLDKLIADTTNCPEMYFEITKEFFEDEKYINTLEILLKETDILKEESKKFIKFDEYINLSQKIIDKIKAHLKENIKLSFSKYENSEKGLEIVLDNLKKEWENKENIEEINQVKKWFKFDKNQNEEDLENATKCQEIYLLNKFQYFKNPLIRENIDKIESFIMHETFDEIVDNSSYSELKECTDFFINELGGLTFSNQQHKKIIEYLFDWWKNKKRWFLFDSWAKEKCLFHYQKNKSINFINKCNNE